MLLQPGFLELPLAPGRPGETIRGHPCPVALFYLQGSVTALQIAAEATGRCNQGKPLRQFVYDFRIHDEAFILMTVILAGLIALPRNLPSVYFYTIIATIYLVESQLV